MMRPSNWPSCRNQPRRPRRRTCSPPEFSKNPRVQLLERSEIEKVYREQSLSAANREYLKLGQILGADGLLVLELNAEGPNPYLGVQLVAVKPGVLLLGERYNWPMKDPAPWASVAAKRFDILLPKLSVLATDAIPISVVNLRSAIQSAASRGRTAVDLAGDRTLQPGAAVVRAGAPTDAIADGEKD